jgi:hypothetical protein
VSAGELGLWTVRRRLTDGGWARWAPDATTLLVSVFAEAGQLSWAGYDEEVTSRAGWRSSPWALPEDDADRGALQVLLAGRSPLAVGVASQPVYGLARRIQRWSWLCRKAGAGEQHVLSDLHRALVHYGVLTDTGAGDRRQVGLGEVPNILDVLPLTDTERLEEEHAQRGEPPRIHRQRTVADR